MSRRLRQQIKNQTTVKVAQRPHHEADGVIWFVTLATFVAGVFYFWYYFGSAPGSVLIGN